MNIAYKLTLDYSFDQAYKSSGREYANLKKSDLN